MTETGIKSLLRDRQERLFVGNTVTAQRIRTEHRLGKLLEKTVGHSGGSPSHRERDLPDGLDHNQSARWQALARLDLADLEALIQDHLDQEDELSTAAMLRRAKDGRSYRRRWS